MQQPPAGIRTYKLRRSRITAKQSAALANHAGGWLLSANDPLPPAGWADNFVAVVLEIGFGMGEATVAYAKAQPEVGVLAVDLHTPGIGTLLTNLEAEELDNVRVVEADALQLLSERLAPASLSGIRVFFPDPWPKARHHKRRLINLRNLDLMASRTRRGGFLHFASDWPEYCEAAHQTLTESAHWNVLAPGEGSNWAQPHERPRTKFEQRGIEAGRPISDLVAVRV